MVAVKVRKKIRFFQSTFILSQKINIIQKININVNEFKEKNF